MADPTPPEAAPMPEDAQHDVTRNPASIWLSPICDDIARHGEGRTWAAPAPDETCEDCSEPWIEYTRVDLARHVAGDSSRKALIEIANMIPGCFASESVTDELLALIPAEVRAWTNKLAAMREVEQAARAYFDSYLLDEADSEDDCVCGREQHLAAARLADALKAVTPPP